MERDLVLDPFLGSGQVAVVCKMLNRQYIGFEIVKEYYEFANARLEKGIYRIKAKSDDEMLQPSLLFDEKSFI